MTLDKALESISPSGSPTAVRFRSKAAMLLFEEVCNSILAVAPDLSRAELEPGCDLQCDLGLDSIDLVNVAAAIAERTGVEIPDAEYTRLHLVGDLFDFVDAHHEDQR